MKIIIAILIIAVSTLPFVLVPERGIIISIGFLNIFIFALLFLKKQKFYSSLSLLAFVVYFLLVAIFVLLNYRYFVIGDNYAFPNLEKDALLYHNYAESLSTNSIAIGDLRINYLGYPVILGLIYKIFGTDIIYGLLANMLLMVLCQIMAGKITFQFLAKKNDRSNIPGYAMFLLCFVPSFVQPACLLIKDSFIIISVLIIIFNVNGIFIDKFKLSRGILAIFGVILLAFFRATYLLLVAIALMIMYRKRFVRRSLSSVVTIFGIVIMTFIGMRYSNYKDILKHIKEQVISNEFGTQLNLEENSLVRRFISSNYKEKPFINKIKLLPITYILQWINPFPLSKIQEINRVPFTIYYVKMNFMWYGVSVFILFFLVFVKRKESPEYLRRAIVASMVVIGIPALTEGGITPRYIVPFIPIIVSGGAFTLELIKINYYYKKKYIYVLLFIGLMSMVMILTYFLNKIV